MRKHPPMMKYIEYKFQNKKSHTLRGAWLNYES